VCAFCSSSLFTNSNGFTFDGDRGINGRLAASVPSSSPNSEEISLNAEETDEVLTGETTGTESLLESASLENGPVEEAKELAEVANDSDATTVSEKFCVQKRIVHPMSLKPLSGLWMLKRARLEVRLKRQAQREQRMNLAAL